jgi:tetratricopeptide (TPR) repeat protein
MPENNDPYSSSYFLLASAYFKTGQKEKSDSIITILIEQAAKKRNIDFHLAVVFASRGEKEKAIQWFKSAYRKHDLWIYNARFIPDFRSVVNEPEVREILKTMGY